MELFKKNTKKAEPEIDRLARYCIYLIDEKFAGRACKSFDEWCK